MRGYQDPPGEAGVSGYFKGQTQDDIARLPQGIRQLLVFLGSGGPGENQVEDDETGPPGHQAAHQVTVQTAGPGPGIRQLLEGRLVNSDNQEVQGLRGRGPQAVKKIQTAVLQGLAKGQEAHHGHERGSKNAETYGPAAGTEQRRFRLPHKGRCHRDTLDVPGIKTFTGLDFRISQPGRK